jgi:hypothetical protein
MNTDKKFPDEDCGVGEKEFPLLGRCCRKNDALFTASYEKICPYCDISVSLPHGAHLKIVIIIECSRYGYGKWVTE